MPWFAEPLGGATTSFASERARSFPRFPVPPFLAGFRCLFSPATGYRLPATGYRLRATDY